MQVAQLIENPYLNVRRDLLTLQHLASHISYRLRKENDNVFRN